MKQSKSFDMSEADEFSKRHNSGKINIILSRCQVKRKCNFDFCCIFLHFNVFNFACDFLFFYFSK